MLQSLYRGAKNGQTLRGSQVLQCKTAAVDQTVQLTRTRAEWMGPSEPSNLCSDPFNDEPDCAIAKSWPTK